MNTNEVDDFLGNVGNEEFNDAADPFGAEEVTTETAQEEPKEEEKPLPFHKDPKVLRFIEKEIAKRAPKESEESSFKRDVQEDEDDYHVRLIGNDTPEKIAMIREARAREERLLQQAEERAFARLSRQQQEQIEAERKAEEKLTNALDEIEETYNVDITSKDPVAKKTRVDFMNFVEKIAPKNERGEIIDYPDMNSAFETFQEMRKTTPNSDRAKTLAARSMGRTGNTVEKPQERITFDNLDGIFDRMFKKS